MTNHLIWQQNSKDISNADNLKAIAQWWSTLARKEVVWQQRLISGSQDLQDIDWQPQKFDEKLTLQTPQIKGITLYWCSDKVKDERNITPNKLQLNTAQQRLYIFPQSQSQVVISITLPEIVYQKLDISDPQIAATVKNDRGVVLLRDEEQKLEIKLTLSDRKLNQLLNLLQTTEN